MTIALALSKGLCLNKFEFMTEKYSEIIYSSVKILSGLR